MTPPPPPEAPSHQAEPRGVRSCDVWEPRDCGLRPGREAWERPTVLLLGCSYNPRPAVGKAVRPTGGNPAPYLHNHVAGKHRGFSLHGGGTRGRATAYTRLEGQSSQESLEMLPLIPTSPGERRCVVTVPPT